MLRLFSCSDYQIPLQREEIETVTKLRDEWANLVLLGDQVTRLTHIIYPVETRGNQRFANVIRGYRKRPVIWNGLRVFSEFWCDSFLYYNFIFNPLSANPQKCLTHSQNSLAVADELLKCGWPFCGIGA